MRGAVPEYELRTPGNLDDALSLLARSPGEWRPFAGGTDLMVLLEAGLLKHRRFVNLLGLSELKGIHVDARTVTLGALTRYSEIRRHPVLVAEFPNLVEAARETGAIAIQNRGTLGGNIANASPAADTPPALLVYEAEVELVSERGARWVDYQDFHTGYKSTIMAPDELLRSVRLRREEQKTSDFYRKVGTRRAQAISKVCFSSRVLYSGQKVSAVRIACGSVAPVPLRMKKTEAAVLAGASIAQARSVLQSEISPIDDIRSTREYRAQVAANLIELWMKNVELG